MPEPAGGTPTLPETGHHRHPYACLPARLLGRAGKSSNHYQKQS